MHLRSGTLGLIVGQDKKKFWDLKPEQQFQRRQFEEELTTTTTLRDTTRQIFDTGVANRTGTRTVVTEQFDNESLGDRVISRDIDFIRKI